MKKGKKLRRKKEPSKLSKTRLTPVQQPNQLCQTTIRYKQRDSLHFIAHHVNETIAQSFSDNVLLSYTI